MLSFSEDKLIINPTCRNRENSKEGICNNMDKYIKYSTLKIFKLQIRMIKLRRPKTSVRRLPPFNKNKADIIVFCLLMKQKNITGGQ